jgi:hypothetical protein
MEYERLIENEKSPGDGLATWALKFEEDYADNFDRAIITSKVCAIRFGPVKECDCVVDWDHKFDTRDPELRAEFLQEVDEVIRTIMREHRK